MKRPLVLCLIIIFLLSCTTVTLASINGVSIPQVLSTFIRYDFKTVKEVPEKYQNQNSTEDKVEKTRKFEPVVVKSGWLYDLSGGGTLEVSKGSLEFDGGSLAEQYIDIKGRNGEIRLLHNSSSFSDNASKLLFWSFKQQVGTSIVKGSDGPVKCAVLFEMPDGSCYLQGYIEGDGKDFWNLATPKSDYFFYTNKVK